jgi:hypothetical protein
LIYIPGRKKLKRLAEGRAVSGLGVVLHVEVDYTGVLVLSPIYFLLLKQFPAVKPFLAVIHGSNFSLFPDSAPDQPRPFHKAVGHDYRMSNHLNNFLFGFAVLIR